jgi:hypothetical protein
VECSKVHEGLILLVDGEVEDRLISVIILGIEIRECMDPVLHGRKRIQEQKAFSPKSNFNVLHCALTIFTNSPMPSLPGSALRSCQNDMYVPEDIEVFWFNLGGVI